jgi:hypothetical protein
MIARRPLTVALAGAAESVSAHRAVLAGLPDRWRATTSDQADAIVIDGGHADWPHRAEAALACGARGLLIASPACTDPTTVVALAEAASAADVVVSIETAYLADAAWKQVLPSLREDAAEAAIIDCLRTVPAPKTEEGEGADLTPYCFDQLGMFEAVVGTLPAVEFMHHTHHQYVLRAETERQILNVAGIRGGARAERLTIDIVGLARRWRIDFQVDAVARPTTVEMMDASGVHIMPSNYQGGRRGAWVELHDAIVSGAPVSYGLGLLVACLRLISPAQGLEHAASRAFERHMSIS